MRNLKKVLTLVLTLAMLLSVMVVGAGAATFGDQESITNKEAVDMCVALNVIGGYEDGTFRPTGNVTRAEMCKMICVALNGGKEPTMGSGLIGTFNDVSKDDWSAPYIEYCVSQGIVGGVGGGRFDPTGNITGTQAAKMLLCILGYDAAIQGYVGNDFWETKINVDAAQKGLYDELTNIDASAPLTRDQSAQMIWNALNANEVEYVTTLVPGPDGTLVSKVDVRDKVVGDNNDKITLLEDKYEADTSVTGIMTKYEWNETKGMYTYTLANNATYSTKADFTDLYGMNVKVISAPDPKATTDKVYGIIPWDSKVVATGVLGDVEYDGDKAIKIDGTKYRTDNAAASLQAYSVNKYTEVAAVFSAEKLALRMEYTFSAIDNDGDNDIDCFVIYPFTVAKVSYAGTTSFNLDANADMSVAARTNIKFEDVNAYDGLAKDDYVKIVNGDYTADGTESFTKITDVVEGKVTSTKSGSAMIDGNWYDYDSTKVAGINLSSTYKLVMVNGYVCAHETITTGADVSDYAVVMEASKAAGVDGNRVKLLFSDGKVEVVAAAADYSTYTDANSNSTPDADEYDWIGKLVTFEIEDGEYKLTAAEVYNGNADAAGFDSILNQGSPNYTYGSNGDSKLCGQRIANDAVIFVKDNAGKYKVITGADLMKYATGSIASAGNVYANKNSSTGFSSIALAYVTLNAGVSVETGNYGYVTSGIGSTKNDKNETVSVLSFWTADGQVTDALADGIVTGVVKGSVITYEKNTDGSYTIKLASQMKLDSVVSYDESAKRVGLASGSELKITADTVILNINSETVKGVEGNQILKAPETATPGVYEKNAYWYSNGGTDLDVIIIDTQNKLGLMPGSVTSKPGSATDVQDAVNSATDVVLDLTSVNTGVATATVPAGSTVEVKNAQVGATLALTAEEGANVKINTTNADKITVNTVAGSTVTISGSTTKIPTITGKGNVVITATGLTGGNVIQDGGFDKIAVVNSAQNNGGADKAISVNRGLELSGSAMLKAFDNGHTLDQLAKLTNSKTVTPVKLDMNNIGTYIDETQGATLTGIMQLKDGSTAQSTFHNQHSLDITTANLDYPTGDGATATGMYMYMTVGDNVKSVTFTVTNKADTTKTNTWTFNFVD